MCAGSDLSAPCALESKLLHRIICDLWYCPDPVKMGAVSPWKLHRCALPSWAGFTAQPVNPQLQLHSSAELRAAARAQCALGWCRKFPSLFLWLRFCSCELWSGVVPVKGSAEYGDRPLGERNVYDTAYKWELTWLMFHGTVTETAMWIPFGGAIWSLFFFFNIWMFFSHPGLLLLIAKLQTHY